MKAFLPSDLDRLAIREREAAVTKLCRSVLVQSRRVLEPGYQARAASSPASTTSAAALTQIVPAFLSTLVPMSAGADVLERGLQLRWDNAVEIRLPLIAIGTVDWVGEGQPIPVRQYTTAAGPSLHPAKLAVITSLSGELMRSSNAEALVKQVLLDSLGPVLDAKLFSNAAAVAQTSPAGLLFGVTPITASALPDLTDAMTADLVAMTAAVSVVAGKSSVAFIANPAQAMAIALREFGSFPYDLLPSNSVPAKTIIAVATNVLACALEDQPQIETSKEMVAAMDTAPAGDLAAASGVVASAFQSDSVALKIRWPISWCVRDVRGVAVVNAVTW